MKQLSKYAIIDSLMCKGTLENLRKTLKHNLDPNIKNHYGDSALIKLVDYNFGDFELFLDLLLKKGADINITNKMGFTPLMQSIFTERYNMMHIIISRDADWNIKNSNGQDFIDLLLVYNNIIHDGVILKYPDKYEQYIIKKEINKFKI